MAEDNFSNLLFDIPPLVLNAMQPTNGIALYRDASPHVFPRAMDLKLLFVPCVHPIQRPPRFTAFPGSAVRHVLSNPLTTSGDAALPNDCFAHPPFIEHIEWSQLCVATAMHVGVDTAQHSTVLTSCGSISSAELSPPQSTIGSSSHEAQTDSDSIKVRIVLLYRN